MFSWSLQLQGGLSLHLSGFISILYESWTWHMGHSTSPALGLAAAAMGVVCRTCSGTTVGQCLAPLVTTFDQCASTDNTATIDNTACPSCQAVCVSWREQWPWGRSSSASGMHPGAAVLAQGCAGVSTALNCCSVKHNRSLWGTSTLLCPLLWLFLGGSLRPVWVSLPAKLIALMINWCQAVPWLLAVAKPGQGEAEGSHRPLGPQSLHSYCSTHECRWGESFQLCFCGDEGFRE